MFMIPLLLKSLFSLHYAIRGAEITHIEARRLILRRNGAREALTLETAEPRRGNNFDNERPGLLRDGREVTIDFSIQ